MTIQDRGRFGAGSWGAGASGALDQSSYQLGNRLVANDPSAACLEVTFGGAEIEFLEPATIALTGARTPATAGRRALAHNAPTGVARGEILRMGSPASGARTYLAVRGGIDVVAKLGSRSSDTLCGLGPPPVRAGDELPLGSAWVGWPNVDGAPVDDPASGPIRLRLHRGPRDDRLADGEFERMCSQRWVATADMNRVGIRLAGASLRPRHLAEVPSEGLVVGAVQVPPSGRPCIFLRDHPITGGYPVVAVLAIKDIDLAAQIRPGQEVWFTAAASMPDQAAGARPAATVAREG